MGCYLVSLNLQFATSVHAAHPDAQAASLRGVLAVGRRAARTKAVRPCVDLALLRETAAVLFRGGEEYAAPAELRPAKRGKRGKRADRDRTYAVRSRSLAAHVACLRLADSGAPRAGSTSVLVPR